MPANEIGPYYNHFGHPHEHRPSTYQSLVLEGIVHGAKEQPEWPQELKAEHKHEVGNHDDGP